LLKVKINLKVGYLLVVHTRNATLKCSCFVLFLIINVFSADMEYHSHAEWRFLMLYFYEYKIRVSQKLL